MSQETPEGFAKKGTTLEGRIAQLLRLMGYDVSRNEIIEGHEVDVYGEKQGERIIVECKEYYTQLIPRDLILIFNSKVKDIKPDEAWFVTINDFEPSALELCNRYGIRALNGYDLEELEDKAVINKGDVPLGEIPREDRYLRLLNRRRTELSRERRRYNEIQKVVEDIGSLRMQRIQLPAFLFPTSESELEEKYFWLSQLEKPFRLENGKVKSVIVNLGDPPLVRGLKINKDRKIPIAPIIAILSFIITVLYLYYGQPMVFMHDIYFDTLQLIAYFLPSIILSIIAIVYHKKLVYTISQTLNVPISNIEFTGGFLHIPDKTEQFPDDIMDLPSRRLNQVDLNLLDGVELGESNDYIIEYDTYYIRGIQVSLTPEVNKETNMEKVIIPTQYLDFSTIFQRSEIRVNALYVLGETFFKQRKMT